MNTKLFIYGTLQRGCPFNYMMLAANSKFRYEHVIHGYRLRYSGTIPIIVPFLEFTGKVDDMVKGEVWDISMTKEIMELERGYELAPLHEDKNIMTFYPEFDLSATNFPILPKINNYYDFRATLEYTKTRYAQ